MRLVLALAVALALTGCGSGEGEARGEPAGFVLEISFSPDRLRSGRPAVWRLVVSNKGTQRATLTFASGKDGDVVLERAGQEAYRWSDDMFFPQVVRPVSLGPGQSQTFILDEDRLDVEPGRYQLVATLAADPAPAPVRREVSVE